ncbi:MAG: hypothetical protein HOV87_13810 [Catenulispora sp.]|nr:hypothetical protein [Catenulispora sp.]
MSSPDGSGITTVVIDFFGTLTVSAPDDVWMSAASASAAPLGLPRSSGAPRWTRRL